MELYNLKQAEIESHFLRISKANKLNRRGFSVWVLCLFVFSNLIFNFVSEQFHYFSMSFNLLSQMCVSSMRESKNLSIKLQHGE